MHYTCPSSVLRAKTRREIKYESSAAAAVDDADGAPNVTDWDEFVAADEAFD
ncbi:hypothetical protein NKF26_14450 [Haladaptatus sp. AB618]|uniref:hypothetical protein n=1 Tax=Haladaptatus sp. AB618 TaxID=2934173 RepID=UPI00209BEE0D|nr:hypothetical protein [Haladaptatus sp. AB618]MCO8255001.1 hypothetical protein [Haladaptatus sp. AB618]